MNVGTAAAIPSHIADKLVSAAAYQEWNGVQADLTTLRREIPFARAEPAGFDPFWVATKYDDVQEISRNPAVFRANGYRVILSSKADFEFLEGPGAPPTIRALITLDPPEHWALRRLTFKEFAPNGMGALEDKIRSIAVQTIDDLLATGGRCDFVEVAALRYPLRIILSILGIPESDENAMLRLTQEFFNPQDPELAAAASASDGHEGQAFDMALLQNYVTYFNALTDDRRANPREDVASKIANGVVDGEPISHWDAMSQYVAIATAGHDTTSSSTAGGMWAVAERPELFARIAADRSLIPKLVDESVRWTSPILNFMRTASEDYQLRGQTVRKGDWVMLSYPSANRDEEFFESPFEFSLDRRRTPHLAFGYGPHVCLGQHLARLEMSILFDELFRRVSSLELDGAPTRTRSATVASVKTLPIRFVAA